MPGYEILQHMSLTFRKAVEADLPAVVEILNQGRLNLNKRNGSKNMFLVNVIRLLFQRRKVRSQDGFR